VAAALYQTFVGVDAEFRFDRDFYQGAIVIAQDGDTVRPRAGKHELRSLDAICNPLADPLVFVRVCPLSGPVWRRVHPQKS
jgi:hypothetical protein